MLWKAIACIVISVSIVCGVAFCFLLFHPGNYVASEEARVQKENHKGHFGKIVLSSTLFLICQKNNWRVGGSVLLSLSLCNLNVAQMFSFR